MRKFTNFFFLLTALVSIEFLCTACPDPDDPYLELVGAPEYKDIAADGVTEHFSIDSNVTWNISGIPAWITINPTQGHNKATVEIKIQKNSDTEPRECTIKVASTDEKFTRSIPVKQFGVKPLLEAGDGSAMEFDSRKDSRLTLQIVSNMKWTITGVPSWLRADRVSGEGNASIAFTTLSENLDSEREATMQVSGGDINIPIVVRQKSTYVTNCKVTPKNMLVMTDAIGFEYSFSSNTKMFCGVPMLRSYYDKLTKAEVIKECQKRSNEDPDKYRFVPKKDEPLFVAGLDPETDWVLTLLAFDNDGNPGELVTEPITTKSENGCPLAEVTTLKYNTSGTSVNYTWNTLMNPYCNSYTCYAAVCQEILDGKNILAPTFLYSDVVMAWVLREELDKKDAPHTTNFNEFYSGTGVEKIYGTLTSNADFGQLLLPCNFLDNFLQIVTWGANKKSEYGGVLMNYLVSLNDDTRSAVAIQKKAVSKMKGEPYFMPMTKQMRESIKLTRLK